MNEKRMYEREFVIYPHENKVMVFNYPTKKGKRNRGSNVMYVKGFYPTPSSWERLQTISMRYQYPCIMVRDGDGEFRMNFSCGESLT